MQRISERYSNSSSSSRNEENKEGMGDYSSAEASSKTLKSKSSTTRRLSLFGSSKKNKKNDEEEEKKKKEKEKDALKKSTFLEQPSKNPSFFDLDRVIGRTLMADGSTDRATVRFVLIEYLQFVFCFSFLHPVEVVDVEVYNLISFFFLFFFSF